MWWAELLNNLTALYDSGIAPSTNSYESIATVTVGAGGSSSITFSSIPSTYKHLQIRIFARSSTAADQVDWVCQLNSDGTAANYASHWVRGSGTVADAGALTGFAAMRVGVLPGTIALSNTFGAMVIDVLDYANTSKNKTLRSLSGNDLNGSNAYVGLWSGLWASTSAVNTITLFGGVTQYSHIALYGVKG